MSDCNCDSGFEACDCPAVERDFTVQKCGELWEAVEVEWRGDTRTVVDTFGKFADHDDAMTAARVAESERATLKADLAEQGILCA